MIHWNTFRKYDAVGRYVIQVTPHGAEDAGGYNLKARIEAMRGQKVITLQEAVWLASVENVKFFHKRDVPGSIQFNQQWVEWLAEQDYRIVLQPSDYFETGVVH